MKFILPVLLFAILIGLWLHNQSTQAAIPPSTPIAVITATLPPPLPATATKQPTVTPTMSPSPTLTPSPTATASATATATATSSPTPTPIDRSCPNPPPEKPIYQSRVLTEFVWPTPNPTITQTHLSIQKPLPGGGRFLINEQFPYGSDGYGRYLLHNGVDSAAPAGMDLLAVDSGTIIVAQADDTELYGWRCNWYGHLVVLELDQQWLGQPIYALYGHVLEIKVSPGQRVTKGEPLAVVGVGGAATRPHLHFELRVGQNQFDTTRNPMLWITPPDTRGILAGRLLDSAGHAWPGVHLTAIGLSENSSPETISWSYLDDPDHLLKPDEALAENFVIHDLKPGDYRLFFSINKELHRAEFTIRSGEISTIELIVDP